MIVARLTVSVSSSHVTHRPVPESADVCWLLNVHRDHDPVSDGFGFCRSERESRTVLHSSLSVFNCKINSNGYSGNSNFMGPFSCYYDVKPAQTACWDVGWLALRLCDVCRGIVTDTKCVSKQLYVVKIRDKTTNRGHPWRKGVSIM